MGVVYMNDRILLEGMAFYGYHGVNPSEKKDGQPFVVDLEMEIDLKAAGDSDNLDDTVDYSQAYGIVKMIIEGQSRNLLESVAEALAQNLLHSLPVDGVKVKVTKPQVHIEGAVLKGSSVEIHRQRNG